MGITSNAAVPSARTHAPPPPAVRSRRPYGGAGTRPLSGGRAHRWAAAVALTGAAAPVPSLGGGLAVFLVVRVSSWVSDARV